MNRTPDELRRLASRDFNAVLAADPVLAELSAEQYCRTDEEANLLAALDLSGAMSVGKLPVRPLTAARWAFLWLLKSPFVAGGKLTDADLNVALYVLSRWDLRTDLKTSLSGIPAEAAVMALAAEVEPDEIVSAVKRMIRQAFLPLAMLPRTASADADPAFDLEWITRICGIAARESNERFTHVLHRMPLALVCALYVDWRRRECTDGNQVFRRAGEETLLKIEKRIDELAAEFLKKSQ